MSNFISPSTVNASQGIMNPLQYVNNVAYQVPSLMILLGVYILTMIGFYKSTEDFAGGLALAGIFTFVVGLLFWISGFLNSAWFGAVIGIAIISAVILFVERRS